MKKIDRLGWAAGVSLDAFGVRLGVRVSRAEALQNVLTCLPPGWKASSEPEVRLLYSYVVGGSRKRAHIRRYHLLYVFSGRLARSMEQRDVLEALEQDMQLRVAELARDRVFVHAGVVGWQGQAIVIPGRSMSGKSQLVAALVRAGATYYSDEFAVLDSRGRVHPYDKPIFLRQANGAPRKRLSAEQLGGIRGETPLPAGLIVVTRYKKGARWRPRARSAGQGILDLLANTVPARRKPRTVLATLRRAVATPLILKGTRGEADDVAADLLDRLSRQGRLPTASEFISVDPASSV